MTNKELASIFSKTALYLEIDDVPFKPKAFDRAAGVLESFPEDVKDVYDKKGMKGLLEIPSIGKGIAEQIEQYIQKGSIEEYDALKKKIPVDIEELTRIEGIGPKAVRDLYKKLHIKTINDLEKAARAGKIHALPNFGEKTEKNILEGIEFLKSSKGRQLLGRVDAFAENLAQELQQLSFVEKAAVAGSIRRRKETIGDIDILVASDEPQKTIQKFLALVPHEKIWGQGTTKVSVRTTEGFDVDMRVLSKEVFGAGLQYFTGSKEHNIRVRMYAAEKGYKLNEYGLYKGKKLLACRSEEDVYKALGMDYIPPELREDAGEIEAALQGTLPNLIEYGSLKGDLQIQTDWTDGKHSIEAMAKEAKRQGLEYIAITDHTKDLAMTGGSDEKKLQRQMAAIDKLNKKNLGITILKGAEVNIRKDGTLDIEDKTLEQLDVVGVSIHSYFKMTKTEMTKRIIAAMQNPNADIFFHPTGRLIQKREAYEVDIETIIKEAKKTKTILEINAFPERSDLSDIYIKECVEYGVGMVIDSDAHAMEHLEYLKYGIAQARRGWAEPKDIINVWPLKKMLSKLR